MIIFVKTKPSQSKTELIRLAEKEYEARLTEPAERNRANRQLINVLAKEFTLPHNAITILNPSSSKKRIKITKPRNNNFQNRQDIVNTN